MTNYKVLRQIEQWSDQRTLGLRVSLVTLALSLTALFVLMTGSGSRTVSAEKPLPSWPASSSLVDHVDRASITVRFRANVTESKRQQMLHRLGAIETSSIPQLRLDVLSVPRANASSVLAELRRLHAIEGATPDDVRKAAAAVSDPAFSSQWALDKIGWRKAFATAKPTRQVRIAVLDTGVDGGNSDFARRLLPGWSAFGTNPEADPNGHGTWMASIAAATADNRNGIAGVAFAGAHIIPVQVLNDRGYGRDSDIAKGVVWAADHHANVILMSFAGQGFSPALQSAIDYAWHKGAVVVAATGNNGSSAASYPAGDAHVVGVSATDNHDRLWAGSNFGPATFIAAPGVGVAADAVGGGTTSITGTSASAALVAGSAALLLSADPRATNRLVIGRLARSAAKAGSSNETGNGRLNLARALQQVAQPLTPLGVGGRRTGGPFAGPYLASSTATAPVIISPNNSSSNNQTNSLTFTVQSAVPVGATIFLSAAENTTTATGSFSATDSGGNTYTQDGDQATNLRVGLLRAYVTTALTTSNTITVTFPVANPGVNTLRAVNGYYTTGLIQTSPKDVGGTANGTTANFSVSTSGATSQAAEFEAGTAGQQNTRTFSSPTCTVGQTTKNGAFQINPLYETLSSIQSPETCAATLSGTANWGAVIATYKVDTTPPNAAITFPSAATYSSTTWTGTLTGTANDTTGGAGNNSALTSVAVSIHDDTQNTYWNGSAWGAAGGAEQYLPVTGVASWSYALDRTSLTNGDSYTIHAQSTDDASNTSTVASQSFVYDTTAASSPTVISPTTANSNGSTNTITFTVQAAVPVGATIILEPGQDTATATGTWSAIDSSGNTYVQDADQAAQERVGILHSYVTTALTTSSTITITYPVAGNMRRVATGYYVKGLIKTSPLDRTGTASGNNTPAYSVSTTGGATAQALEWVATAGLQDNTRVYNSPTCNVGQSVASGAALEVTALSNDLAATANPASCSATLSGNAHWGALIATYKIDVTAPTTSISFPAATAYNSAGWTGTLSGTAADTAGGAGNNSALASVDLSIHDDTLNEYWTGSAWSAPGAAESANLLAPSGLASWTYGFAGSNLTNSHTYTIHAKATDDANNHSTATQTFIYDTTPPTNAFSLQSVSTYTNGFGTFPVAYYSGSGTNIYYNGSAGVGAQTFKVRAAVSDPGGSGGASVTTASFANGGSNMTHTDATTTTPGSGNFDTNVYSFTPSTSGTASSTLSTKDAAGNISTAAGFSIVNDTTGPTGGAVSVNGTAATGAGTSSYLNAGASVTINSRTDYTTDATSIASSTLDYKVASLTANACGSYGASTVVAPATTTVSVSSGNCYLFTLTGVDALGNSSVITTTVKVDTTAPSDPTYALSEPASDSWEYESGSTLYFNPAAAGNHTFRATASTTDADSAIADVTFVAPAGLTCSGGCGVDTTSPYTQDYTWNSSTTSNANAKIGTAHNNDGLASAQTGIVLTSDAVAPASSITFPTASTYNSTGWATITGTSSDGGSGMASVGVSIQDTTVGGSSCYDGVSAFNQPCPNYLSTGGTPASWSYTIAAARLTNAHSYTITSLATDNVSNQTTSSKSFTYDTAPATMSSATVASNGTTVTVTWSESLDQTGAVPGSTFSMAPNGGAGIAGTAAAVSYPAPNQTQFTLSSAVHHLDSLALTYTKPGSDPMVRDLAQATGNATNTATLNNASITNNTTNVAPTTPALVTPADTARVNSTTPTLTATFSDPDTQDTGKVTFEVCANGTCSSSLGTFDSSSTTLAVGANGSGAVPAGFGLTSGNTYYWRAKNVDSSAAASSNSSIRSFVVDTVAPTIASASVAANGQTVTVTWSENLDQTQAVAGSAFSVNAIAGTAAAVSYPAANQTQFTLSGTVHHLDVLSLSYTQPGGTKIRDAAVPVGNAAASASGIAVTNNTANIAPTTPALVSPADTARLNTSTPTLSATFSDPDPNDTGKITFQVCTDSGCTSPLGTFDSTNTSLAVGANGSAAVPGGFGLSSGTTYYWRAKNTDSSAAASSFSATRSFIVDTTPPTISSASVAADGTTVTITWSENLDQTQAVAGSAFSINGTAGTAGAVSYPAANQTQFTLSSAVHHLDVLTLSYTQPGGTKIRDTATPSGNAAASAGGVAVTNNTANIAPTTPALVSPADTARLNSATPTLTATFSDPDPNDTGKVTFEVCTTSNCSSSLGTFDSTSTTLAVGANGSAAVPAGFSLANGSTYYWRAKNTDSSNAASSFTSTRSFLVDTQAPTITAASVGADGQTMTLTWSENLDQTQAMAASAFSVNGIAGTASAVSYPSANQTQFTLSSAVHHLDVLTLSYTQPAGTKIRDTATPTGNPAASIGGVAVTNNTANIAPTTPSLVSPADTARLNSAMPTLTATFSDPDPNDNGKVTFQVCTDASCTTSLGSFDSTSTSLAVGTNGSAAVPGGFGLTTGNTYYWRAKNTDSSNAASSFSATRSFLVDTTAPTISSASVAADGTTVTVTWSENLDQTQAVAGSAFDVNSISGTAAAVTYPAANKTQFALSSAVHHLDVLTLDYAQPAGTKVRDTATPTGNAAASASGIAVTNNTANATPSTPSLVTPSDATRVNNAIPALTATFSDPDPNDTGTVTFQVCGNASCTAGGDPISTFSTAPGLANNTNGTASVPGAANLTDGTYYWRAKDVDSASASSAYSGTRSFVVDTIAPTMSNALVAADGTTVTITWSESLDQTQAVPGSFFSVNGIAGTAAATTYPAANQTRFTLSSAVHYLDSLSLSYTAPGSNPKIRDAALPTGNAAVGGSLPNGSITNNTTSVAPTTPVLVSPADTVRLNNATPTLTATFSDPDPNDNGKITFQVCAVSDCSTQLGTFDSTNTAIANGASGSKTIPGGTISSDGTYYWRAKGVDSSSTSSSYSAIRSFVVDTTAPTISAASISADGQTVTVSWNENLDSSQAVSGAAFSITRNGGAPINGTAAAVSYPAPNETQFALSSVVHHLDNLTLTYTEPGAGAVARDAATPTGNAANTGSIGNVSITNNTGNQTPFTPTLVSPNDGTRVNSATPLLSATFSDPDDNDTGTLTFQVCGNATCTAAGDPITTFSSAAGIANNTNGNASVPGAANLADGTYYWRAKSTDSSNAVSSYSLTHSFTVDTTPPAMTSATVAADGTTVTVTWSENLDQSQAVAGSAFSIVPNGGAGIAGTGSAVTYPAANQTRFTLSSPVHHLDSLALTYTKPGANPMVRDLALPSGIAATTATVPNGSITNSTPNGAPTQPTLISPPDSASVVNLTPTLVAQFNDPDPADTGTVTFQVCSDAACSSVLSTFSSTSSTVPSGSNGSAAIPAGVITGGRTVYWRAKGTDSSSSQSSYSAVFTLTIVQPDNDPNVPTLVSPANNAFTQATPTLTAKFTDSDSGDTGTIDFRVCGNSTCTAGGDPVSTFSSPSGIANGSNGSASVPPGLADGTYYWSARATDDSNQHSAYSSSRAFTVDTVAPTNAFSLTGVSVLGGFPVAVYPGSGSTIYYNSNAGIGFRSFSIRATVTDASSGSASVTTQNFSAGASNLSHTDATTTTPGSGTYDTSDFTYLSPTSGSGSVDVFTKDVAGNQSATTSFTLQSDSSAPTAAVTFPAAGGAYNGSGWTGTLTGTAADAGAGVNAVKVSIRDVTAGGSSCWGGGLFNQPCPTYLAATGTTAWSYALGAGAFTNGHTYSITVETIDALGNIDGAATTSTFTWDTTPPTISSAVVAADGATVTVTWSESLDQTQAVPGSAFSITPNGGAAINGTAAAVTYPAANQTQFTLSTGVHHLDTLTLGYAKPGFDPMIRDAALATGNPAVSVSGIAATNNATNSPPSTPALVSPADAVRFNSATPSLTATFSDPDSNDTGHVTFQICSDSGCSSPLGTVDSPSVANGANGTASVPGGMISSDGTYYWRAKNVDASALSSSYSATRSFVVDTTAPTISSSAVAANGTTLTVTWSENLDQTQAVAGSAFQVNGIPGTAAAVSYPAANQTQLTLSSAVHHLDTLTLAYTQPGGAKVRDLATPTGNAAATVTGVAVTNNTANLAPTTPALVSPANGARINTATPSLSATFNDPDPSDSGKVTFEVCTDASCATSLGTFQSSTVANGANGSASVPGGWISSDGTYYWRAQNVDSSNATSSFSATRSFIVDTTAPTIASAAVGVDGTTVTVTWSENVDQAEAVPGSAFAVNGVAGTAAAVTYPAANQARFSLPSAVHHGDVLTLAYTKPGSDPMIRDTAPPTGNPAASASGIAVTNNAGDLPPTTPALVSPADAARLATATPTLTATFADPDTQDTGKVTFQVCAVSDCSTPLATFDSTSTTLAVGTNGSAAVPGGAVSGDGTYYWRAKNVDSSLSASSYSAIRSFVVDTTAPTISSAAVGADGTTLTITWNENLDQTQAVAGSAFSVNGIAGSGSVSYPAANKTQLSLSSAVHHLDVLTLGYTKPGSNPMVRDAAQPTGNPAVSAGGVSVTNNTADLAPSTPALVSPADASYANTATPTLTATFSDPDPNDSGKVTFQVCSDSSCTSPLGSFDSSSTSIANGSNGSGAVPAGLNLQTATTYYWRAKNVDSSSTSSSFSATRSFTVDLTAPNVSVTAPTAGAGSGFQWYDGTTKTLWLNAGQTGTFTLHANASDAQSGVAQVAFPALFGTSANNDTTSPYDSPLYTFDGTVTPFGSPGAESETATNGAGSTASDQITINADNTAPGAFSMLTPSNATSVGTGVNVSAQPTDSGSGLRQVQFFYCDATSGPCAPAISLGLGTPVLGVYSVTWNTTALIDGHQYAVDSVATDNVGHTTTSSISTVLVDNSPPVVATQAPTAVAGGAYQYYNAGAKMLWLNATQSGSFKLRATASDPHSSISSVTFPALLGTAANPGTINGGAYESSTYSFSSPTVPGSKTINAANGVTNPAPETATDSIDVEVDGAPPATTATFPLNNGSYGPGTWNGSCTPSGLCGTVTDLSGSGVAQVKISIKDRTTGKYWGGTAFDQAAQTFNNASLAGANWSYALDQSALTAPHAYLVELYSVDNVGNTEVHQQIRFTYGNDVGGPTTALTLSSSSHAYLTPSAPYVLYYGTANGAGNFTLRQSATDPSGVDTIAFPDLSGTSGFSGSGGTATNGSSVDPFVATAAYSFTGGATTPPAPANVDSTDLRGNPTHDQVTFVLDNAVPAAGSLSVNGGTVYSTTATFPVSHIDYTDTGSGLASSTLTVQTATLSNGTCGSFGSATPASDGSFAGSQGTCYRFTLTGVDNVGNVATTSADVKVDTTAPSVPAVSFSNLSAGNTYDNGAGNLYYRPSAGGTFTVNATSTDAESGVQSYTFSPLAGFASTNQVGGALNVTFNGSSTGSGAATVHATNNAGSSSTDTSYHVTPDSTAPSGGSMTVNGILATGAGSSSYLTSGGSVAVATTPYSDGGSGMASQVVTVQQATLSNDSCGTYGGSSVVGGASYGVSNGSCYLFTFTATDNVGNVTNVQTTVKADTTAPVAPTVGFTGASAGNTFVSGSTLYYRPSASGTFTVNANGASDPETGIKSGNPGYTFASLPGFLSTVQTGNRVDVTFDGSSTGGGTYSVAATNNAGVSSTSASFTVVKDAIAPVNGLLSINPYAGSHSVTVGETPFTDADSGVATNVLTRSDPQPASGGVCPGSGYTGTNAVTLPTDTVPADGCYQYTLSGTDHVGNVSTYRTIVLVDTTAPTGGSISYVDGLTSLSNIQVTWASGSDAESGLSGTTLMRASASLSGSTCGSFGSFSPVAGATSPYVDSSVSSGYCYQYEIVVTNNAGVSSTFTSSAVAKLTSSSPITLSSGAPSGTYRSGAKLWLGPSAAGHPFTLELTSLGQNGVTSTTWPADAGALSGAGSTANSAPFTSAPYTWSGSAVNDTLNVTRAPNTSPDSFTVQSDLTNPTGTIDYTNGTYSSHSVHITMTAGDGESGVGSTQVLRASAPLTGSTCGSFTPYSPVTLNGSGDDTSVVDNTCYSYELTITDNVGNTFTATSGNVAQIPDITPPTFLNAATNPSGTQLTITMSEALDPSATTPASAFTLTYDGTAEPSATGISVSGATVTLTLAHAPNNSQDVKVRYTQPSSSSDRMRDQATPTKNETPNFGPVFVTNNTTDTVAPSLGSSSVNADTVTLLFDETLAGAAPDASAFTVSVGSTHRSVTGVSMSGKTITLTISPAVTSNDNVSVSYAVPALNALHDAAGNHTSPFTVVAANQTPAVVSPGTGGGGGTIVVGAPALVSASPDDGTTVPQVSTISLSANESAQWKSFSVTRPDGTVAQLPDNAGQSATWPFAATALGQYVLHGTIAAGGQSTDVLLHFTVWTPSAGSTSPQPPVQKNGSPLAPGQVQSPDGQVTVTWPAGTWSDDVVVEIERLQASSLPTLPKDALAVQVLAFIRSTHARVTQLNNVLDIRFANASQGAHPIESEDGVAWSDIPQLPTLNLPAGQPDGWFRDSDGTIHVLTRHLTYFALVGQDVSSKLAMRIMTVRRLWLHDRTFIAVRMELTMPARVTGNFVAPDGTVVLGQTIKTPTRHAGVTILRVPLHVTQPGSYRLEMHADGAGQAVDRTANVVFTQTKPTAPWQHGTLRLAVVRGTHGLRSLGRRLGSHFVVKHVADANLYDVLDTDQPTAAAAIIVDLGTVPTYTLAELHALLPEVRIVGMTSTPSKAAYYKRIGVTTLLPRTATAAQVATAVTSAVR